MLYLALRVGERGYLLEQKFRLLEIIQPGERALLKVDDFYTWNARLDEEMDMVRVTGIEDDRVTLVAADRY